MIASLVGALAFASPAQALGLTFNWSYTATSNNGTGATLGTVSGTISGLQDNTINTSGLTATVLNTPDDGYEGLTFNSIDSGEITVSGGSVTAFDIVFRGSNRSGSGVSSDVLSFWDGGQSTYQIDNSSTYDLSNYGANATFSPAATPVPFDFDPSFGLVALGGIWAGRKVIKKIKTSKKSV